MRIVVAYKWAPDPREASITGDGHLDWGRARSSISDDDPVAIETGRLLADATGAELIGLTVGGPEAATPAARKASLARGLDSLVAVTDSSLGRLDTTQTALQLAAAVKTLGEVDLVLAGDASIDSAARAVPAVLAGALGWPCILQARTIAPTASGVEVARDGKDGLQTLLVPLPAVIALAPDAAAPRVPGMRDILAASKKPVTSLAPATPTPPTAHEVASARPPQPARRRSIQPGEDPDAAALTLVATLRSEGVW